MKTVYLVQCKQCSAKSIKFDDPHERDNRAIEHYQLTGHKQYRRWTEDLIIDNPIEGLDE